MYLHMSVEAIYIWLVCIIYTHMCLFIAIYIRCYIIIYADLGTCSGQMSLAK